MVGLRKRGDTMGTMSREESARIAHEINAAFCAALGDFSQPTWENAPDLGTPTHHVYRCNKGHVWEESRDPLLILPAQIVRVSNLPSLNGVYCLRCLLEPLGKVECVE